MGGEVYGKWKLWGIVELRKIISWENVGWVVGSRVGGEVYGEWKLFGIVT